MEGWGDDDDPDELEDEDEVTTTIDPILESVYFLESLQGTPLLCHSLARE